MIVYDGDGERTLIEAHNCATKAVDFILKGVNIDDMIPDSVKAQEDAELSDITLYADERVRVVNVRRDSRIRFFFTPLPTLTVANNLRGRLARMLSRAGRAPLCTRLGVFGYIMRSLVYPIWRFRVHYAPPLCTRLGVLGYIMRTLVYPIGRFRVHYAPHCVPDWAFSGTYAHPCVPDWAFSGTLCAPLCTRLGVFGYIMRHLVYPIWRFRVRMRPHCVPDLAFSGTLCATLCTRLGVFGYAYTAKQIHKPLVDIVVRRAFPHLT